MSKRLVIIGASGHGKVIADIAEKNGYNNIIFLDDNNAVKNCGKYPVVGTVYDAGHYSDMDFIVGIGRGEIRKKIQEQLIEKGLNIISLIHPKAVVADDTVIGIGTVVMAGAVINPGATIGNGCIVNTGATVDHDNIIDDYVHISVGSHLAGSVHVGKDTWVGAGATIINNVNVCENCVIGAGAVVVDDIKEPDIYIGVPARKMSMNDNRNNRGGGVLLTDNHYKNLCYISVFYGTERRAA